MKTQLLTFLLILCLGAVANCQVLQKTEQPIEIKNVWGGTLFYQNGERLSLTKLDKILKSDTEAYSQFKRAKGNSTIASILGAAGGAAIGWQIGAAIGGGEPNWGVAGIGAGFIAIGIPISIKSAKQAKLAVNTYNKSHQTTGIWKRTEIKLAMKGNGIGLSFVF